MSSPLPINIRGRVEVKACGWGQGWEGSMTVVFLHSGEADISTFPASCCWFVTSSFRGRLKERSKPSSKCKRKKEAGSNLVVQENIPSQYLSEISQLHSPCLSVSLNHSNLVPQPFNLSLLCPGCFTPCCVVSCFISHSSPLRASSEIFSGQVTFLIGIWCRVSWFLLSPLTPAPLSCQRVTLDFKWWSACCLGSFPNCCPCPRPWTPWTGEAAPECSRTSERRPH